MSESISNIIDNIYFTSKQDLNESLVNNLPSKITHVLCLFDKPRVLRKLSSSINKMFLNTKKHIILEKEWILYLADIHTLLTDGESGSVWILSEEKQIVNFIIITYLISVKNKSIAESFKALGSISDAPLSENIFYQLQLWSGMGGKLDSSFHAYAVYQEDTLNKQKRFFMPAKTCINISLESETKLSDVAAKKLDGSFNPYTLPEIGSDLNWGYCCKNCKRRIFSSSNIINHNEDTTAQPLLNDDYKCSVVFVEPLRWMHQLGELKTGVLHCYGCFTEIGCWSWKKTKCSTCKHSVPVAFQIETSALEFVSRPVDNSTPKTRVRSNIFSKKLFGSALQKQASNDNDALTTIIARNSSELPKLAKKNISKSKLSLETCDEHWILMKRIFLFTEKLRIKEKYDPGDDEKDEDMEENGLRKLPVVLEGLEYFYKDMEFEKTLKYLKAKAELDSEVTQLIDHPVVKEYIKYVIGELNPSTLQLMNHRTKNYADLVAVSILKTGDPKEVFKLAGKMGKGGFGKVYSAKEIKTGKKFAIKKMDHTGDQIPKNFKEVAVLAVVNHPNIVKFYDCYELGTELWVVMESMEGGSLKDLHELQSFEEDQLAYVAKECLKALDYLHGIGLCHRDLKPGNIMLSTGGTVKLIDFGLCETVQAIAEYPKLVGSPLYMPPEMILNMPQTIKADVWSLGCTLYQLIDPQGFHLGNTPIKTLFTVGTEGRTKQITSKSLMSKTMRSFLRKTLARDPKDRPTVKELLSHPFIVNAPSSSSIEPMVDNYLANANLLRY